MSDRIAVFRSGKIEQLGTPSEIYDHPASAFVAGFVGTSNLVEGVLAKEVADMDRPFLIRPERIRMLALDSAASPGEVSPDEVSVVGRVRDVIYLGMYTRYHIDVDGGLPLTVAVQNLDARGSAPLLGAGRRVRLAWSRAHMHALEG